MLIDDGRLPNLHFVPQAAGRLLALVPPMHRASAVIRGRTAIAAAPRKQINSHQPVASVYGYIRTCVLSLLAAMRGICTGLRPKRTGVSVPSNEGL